MSYQSWRTRVDKANIASYNNGHNEFDVGVQGRADPGPEGSTSAVDHKHAYFERRWWGTFTAWLNKINTITKEDGDNLPMGLSKLFNIYSDRLQCTNPSGVTINAGLDIIADVRLQVGSKYVHYFSGTVVPPKIIDTHVFLGAHPNICAGIDIRRNTELIYESERKKLILTITFLGLLVKGIATVGPSLDLWGQIKGNIGVSGQLKVGAKYVMEPSQRRQYTPASWHQRCQF